ncbi:hypothetical protein [Leptospira stimsonii]|uniref:hypothetical protein n=1 Tax=Leptospira stimsonii TaxID=2202203 RepID=UPI0011C48751|nr:hypothetical protein [Leptospira stimsonii]
MNFTNDLLLMARAYFTSRGIQIPDADKPDKILRLYLNSVSKLVSAQPRKVLSSKELSIKRSRLNLEDQNAITEILEKIKSGNNFEGHLSSYAFKQDYNDLLLNDWKINHFHISNKKKSPSDFFYKRADFTSLHFLQSGICLSN